MGYGSRALQLLQDYFEGQITNLSEAEMEVESVNRVDKVVSPMLSQSWLLFDCLLVILCGYIGGDKLILLGNVTCQYFSNNAKRFGNHAVVFVSGWQ